MHTVKHVAELTHLASRQVYDRITALAPVLNGTLQTGSRGAKLLTDNGFAIFRRLLDLENDGLSKESAIKVIQEDLVTPDPGKTEGVRNDGEGEGKLIATLEQVISDQRREIEFLRAQIDRLTPLALLRPRRGLLGIFRQRREV